MSDDRNPPNESSPPEPSREGREEDPRLKAAIRAAAGGDREAFTMIVRAYEAPVGHLATRLLGNVEEGRDLSQEVFISLWKVLPRIDLERPLLPYLYRATVNKAARLIRRRPPFIALDPMDVASPASPVSPVLAHQLRRGMARLSRGERLVMALVSFEGYSAVEVAQLTGRSPATVRQLLMRGRNKLAKYWEKTNG
jgi:RNA polymerase sigma factor (sigma-70 family)